MTEPSVLEAEVMELERAWTAAIVANDADGVARFTAPDWIIVGPDGRIIDRSRFLDVIRSGALTHRSMESEDVRVLVHGDSVVVTALTSASGSFAGQPFSTNERATDVWVWRDGRWECVITHLTSYNPGGAPS